MENVTRIIDGGANVGLSALYFALKYPSASVIAIEPDPENFQLALANTAQVGERCHRVQAALWSRDGHVFLRRGTSAWSTQVQREDTGESQVRATTLSDVCRDFGWPSADIVKLDIEGAETEVLACEAKETVTRCRCWALELHSEAARATFDAIFRDHDWTVTQRGEVTFACRTA